MFREDRRFIKGLLTESSKGTVASLIKSFDLPPVLHNILFAIYVEGLEIKQIAYNLQIDDRTVKARHAKALDAAEDRCKELLRHHF